MEPGRPDGLSGSCHVAAIPYPGRGHINPMMNLCRVLASRGLLLTVVVTEEWLSLLGSGSPLWAPNLRFRTIPDVLPSERTRGDDLEGFVQAVFTKMEEPVEALLEGLEPPVDFIVTDSFLVWAAEIARRRDIPVSSLWTQSASVFMALYTYGKLVAVGQVPLDFSGEGNEPLAYLPRVATPHLADLLSEASSKQILRRLLSYFSWFATAQSLLFTSFHELESQVVDTLSHQLPVPIYSLGPCIPHMTLCEATPDADAPSSYIKWLDSQPISSVLYISLGSFLPISGPQMDEMAMGLRESRVRFLWVARGELESINEASGGTSMVVPWCDQLRALCHPSVGGFLTHCGWNSTLEGIFAGVPMLTFPLIWDQFSNSKLIVDDWKVGLRLKDEAEERIIEREEIARMVKKLMDSNAEERRGPWRKAAELKDQCRKAIEEDGSSSTNLDAFVQGLISKKKKIQYLSKSTLQLFNLET